jgi:exopolysaccharide biosynthesis polyprenyl glycosylphosphotransferase
MALPQVGAYEATVRPPVAKPAPRLPLSVVVPAADGFALAIAALAGWGLNPRGAAFVAVAFLVLWLSGSQRMRINPVLSQDLVALAAAAWLPALAIAPFARDESAASFLLQASLGALALGLGRVITYQLIKVARLRGLVAEPALIVGAGPVAIRVAEALTERREYGLIPVGLVDSVEDREAPFPILGPTESTGDLIRLHGVARVIICFGRTREPNIVRILRECSDIPVEIYFVPRFFELGAAYGGLGVEDIWGIPVVRLRRSFVNAAAWRAKRLFDVVLATAILLITLPVFLATAAAVKLTSRGPVFFRQKRVGQRGRLFQLLKFRTLVDNDDSDVAWSVAGDWRVTRVGRFLRRTGLDELPQLINVIRGDMSLVGPRPERPYFADQFRVTVHGYEERHRVPVGVTGWAQIHGLRGDTSIEDRAVFDNYYIENWSLWRDVVILARTIGTLFRRGTH